MSKKPLQSHITVNSERAEPDEHDTRHYCADCRMSFKCPNPDKPVMARVLNNCSAYVAKMVKTG